MENQFFFEIHFCENAKFYFRMLNADGSPIQGKEQFAKKGTVPLEFEHILNAALNAGKFEILNSSDGIEYFTVKITDPSENTLENGLAKVMQDAQ